MHEADQFLKSLAVVLCVAAVATVAFQRLKLPVVFGYLLAGLIIGPHIPIPFVADEGTVRTLAELGVILLMFSLGLEFNFRKLMAVAPTAGVIALAQASAMMFAGFALGQMFGWTTLESVFAGAIIAISSTTIIVKAFAEQNVRGKVTEIVFGVLIIEDLIAIFLLVLLTAFSSTGGISPATLGMTALRLAMFLAGLIGIGLLIVPRLIRIVVSLGRKETTLVASIGICFASSWLALSFGYSVALGAFLAGSLIAESGTEKVVEHLVHPVRDMFAAIFFVSVGMMIDPARIAENWVAVLAFSFVVITGNLIVVSISAFLTGLDTRTSVQAGMSLGQIGEFSFIIAGLGLATGATGNFLYPVAIAVSALTTMTTPIMIRSAEPVAAFVDRHLPRPLQTFAALYG
jgi:CPA2 family monovalent cation:H+ antiporter-2